MIYNIVHNCYTILMSCNKAHHYHNSCFQVRKKTKIDRHKKNHPINLDKSFWPCPTQLDNQIRPSQDEQND
jgi:hypothetical protein